MLSATNIALGGPGGRGSSDSVSNASVWQALADKFTGNLTYQRNMALQKQAQTFNAEEAAKQRAFEERLANTAFQRQAADLKAAGYNPAMALGAGGAATPSGAAASSGHASYNAAATSGWKFLLDAVLMGASLGVRATQSASQIALNEIKGQTLGAGSASQIALNTHKINELVSRSALNYGRANEVISKNALNQALAADITSRSASRRMVDASRAKYYDVLTGYEPLGPYR